MKRASTFSPPSTSKATTYWWQRGFIVLCLLFLGCEESVPGGEITIRNDSLDKQFNSFTVDQIKTSSGSKLFGTMLRPGKEVTLPYRNIVGFRIERRYANHAKVYEVSCPPHFDKRLTIKLIDIHSNRLSGGCETSRYGEVRNGITKWKE